MVALIVVGVAAYAITEHNSTGKASSPLIVYSADAYVKESSTLLSQFHNKSGASVAPVKGGGSLTDARQIGQGSPSDVFISVSLSSYGKSYLHSRYSGWAVAFASDQMVLAYSSATKANSSAGSIISQFSNASRSNSTSGYNAAFTSLTSGNVKVGIANPNSDPAGFRGWLTLEIAGYVFHDNNTSYYTHRISANGGNISAGDASQLVSPLESGNIQFLFIYRSAAIVKGLNYIALPASVNLGSVNYAGFYSGFSYNLSSGSATGAPIYLYITALNGSSDMQTAMSFTEYVLNNTALLKAYGLTPITPALLYNSTAPPPGISEYLSSGKAAHAGGI
ncbi:hypothetical protein IX51_00840 [uncultured archaeon]|nr:hypothetical protein IX51_00840 [uncultured archaeon]